MTMYATMIPRSDLVQFLPNPRAVSSFEGTQKDVVTMGDIMSTGSFLTVNTESEVPASRKLASTATDITLTDGGAASNLTLALAATAVAPGTYGDLSHFVSITVDAKGRLTAASQIAAITTNVAEGTNLYYTDARARNALSGGTGIAYTTASGLIALDTSSSRNVDHATVSISAGAGLTGGGTIAATRTIAVAPAGAYGAPSGTLSRASLASYTAGAGLTYSPAYVQAEQTATGTRLAAVEAALAAVSQILAALVTDLRTNGNLT